LEKALASYRGAGVSVTIMGEVLPRFENFVSIDKNVVDAWGIPALHVQARYTDNEFKMAKHAMNTFAEVCHDAGFEILAKHEQFTRES